MISTFTNRQWLLLVLSLPTTNATARMRIWRALKALGCGSLRDGAYLLPQCSAHQQQLRDLADETVREGGSAWLIRRYIDPLARFLWLDSPADCPADALGFDFDGAAFTHIGERVTFEVLLASFGLEPERGLQRLGAMVHALDVGGAFVPEASGFEAMLAGARQRAVDDDQLLAEIGVVLDALYAHFSNEPPTTDRKNA